MSSIVQKMIEKKLRAAFSPEALDVINESHLHAAHHHADGRSFDGRGETHFRVRIISPAFSGMKRIDRHRAVNHTLKAELNDSIHALVVEAKAPGEQVVTLAMDPIAKTNLPEPDNLACAGRESLKFSS